jgi:AraC-like DNA-binding protein
LQNFRKNFEICASMQAQYPSSQPAVPLHEWASIHMELLWAYDAEVPPQYREWTASRQRPVHRAWMIRQGQVRVILAEGRSWEAHPGCWIFPPPDDFRQQFSSDARILSVSFLCSWPSGDGLFSQRECVVIDSSRCPALEREASQLARLVRRSVPKVDTHYYERPVDCGSFLALHTSFLRWLQIWVEVLRNARVEFSRKNASDERVVRAIRILNTSPLAEGLPREKLLLETDISEAHLNRLFCQEFNMTVRQWWERRKLLEAKRLLETSQIPVKEISYRLGFRSDANFMTWFKKLTRRRPMEYRKTHGMAQLWD